MKKLILSAAVLLMVLTTQAQQKENAKPSMRQRMSELMAETDQKAVDKKLKDLQKSKSEEDLILAYSYYANKEMTTQADAAHATILKKYPDGQLAQQEALNEIAKIEDVDQKDQKFKALYNKYPDRSYGYLPFTLGQEVAEKGDENKMLFYAEVAAKSATDSKGNPLPKEYILASMAAAMTKSNPDAAAKYLKYGVATSKASLDEMLAQPNTNANLLQRSKNNHFAMLSSYMYALSNGSNPELGYQLAKENYDLYKKDPNTDARTLSSIEQVYTYTLVKTSRNKEALPYIESFVKAGTTDKATLANLKTAYVAVNGSEENYPAYEAKLLADQKASFKEEVEKMAINEPSHDFQLKDVDGNTVKLSDYKGKVVVLDFWATWCGPCKASFPAMQKAVNKYKNDDKVQFLFLHTWEKKGGNPTEAAKKYITDNNYTFKVLMDLRDAKTDASAAATAYKVDGIPAKFIIDTKGNIRFSASGMSADADKAVEELSNMIEFAKKS